MAEDPEQRLGPPNLRAGPVPTKRLEDVSHPLPGSIGSSKGSLEVDNPLFGRDYCQRCYENPSTEAMWILLGVEHSTASGGPVDDDAS
jgi:hypothetical protein